MTGWRGVWPCLFGWFLCWTTVAEPQGDASGGGEEEEEAEAEQPKAGAPVEWKKGFPKTKPGKTQSVATFRADFAKLVGAAFDAGAATTQTVFKSEPLTAAEIAGLRSLLSK